jgi:Transcriptional regulatory protein, C terminal
MAADPHTAFVEITDEFECDWPERLVAGVPVWKAVIGTAAFAFAGFLVLAQRAISILMLDGSVPRESGLWRARCKIEIDINFETGTNVVEVYVDRLRRKVDDFHAVKLLQTVRGVGYILKGSQTIVETPVLAKLS